MCNEARIQKSIFSVLSTQAFPHVEKNVNKHENGENVIQSHTILQYFVRVPITKCQNGGSTLF